MFLAYLSHLSLTNYRNLVSMELDLPRGVLVFFGPNAQGKTTLLEAAYTMAIARSFRAENEREVVNFDAVSRGEMALVGGALGKRWLPTSGIRGLPAHAQSEPGQWCKSFRSETDVVGP